ncbi:MAG: NTP transferase domain-containing protein [Desulfovibrionaceae bacterium]|nr:NTP transferase domain-containing protein [Desulfovibrionaceae bacterium]
MQALILAGGKGTRLRPYTAVLPKPLMPLGDASILSIILRQLKRAGATEVILAVNYLHHIIQAVLGDGGPHGLKITYSLEERELGTAGPIALAFDRLDDDFLILNGDILTTLDFAGLFAVHREGGQAATIAVHPREVPVDFGVIRTDEAGLLIDYDEKPTLRYEVSMGVNVLNKAAIAGHIEKNVRLDMPDLLMRLARAGEKVFCRREPCFWLDIGRIDDYNTANQIFDSMKKDFLPES